MSATDSGSAPGPIDFSTFVLSLGTSALVQLGEAPLPGGEPVDPDVEGARQTIDILAMLEAKTAGNLSEQEASLLKHLLTDLRLRFVRAGK